MGEAAADWISWICRKMSKKCLGGDFWEVADGRWQNVQKMSWGPAGVQLGLGKISKKCQTNVPRHFRDIFVDMLKPFW